MEWLSRYDFTCSVCKCKKNEGSGSKASEICIECRDKMNNILTVEEGNLQLIKTELYVMKGTEDYKYFPVNGHSKEKRYNINTYKYGDINVYGCGGKFPLDNNITVYIHKDQLLKDLFR